MRSFKFRAWDKKEKKWLFGYDYGNLGGFSLIGEFMLNGGLNSISLDKLCDDVVITQFTGLLDKDGKEIYEGDVISSEGATKYTVEWDSSQVCFIAIGDESDKYGPFYLSLKQNTGHSVDQFKKVKIIGNIFQK